ncbi:SMI1/KNR4 family protein, partial [Dysosmobacter welbionis]
AEGQDGAGALGHGDVRGVLGHAHHGAAGDQFVCTVLQAAAGVQQAGDGGADGALQVLGLHHAGAGDGDDLAHHGHTGGQGPVDGACGVDVEYGAADIGGQSAGGHLAAGDGLAELFLTALGVAAAQGLHHHGGLLLGNDLVHGVDAVALVVLHADDDLVHAEHLGQELGAANDLLGPLQHGAVVARDVGLALRAIDDDGVHLADAAGDLHVG